MPPASEVPSAGEILVAARTDVTVEPQGDKFVVHDPRKHSFTQLGVAEYIVFRCFDGRSTAQAIADRLRRERDVIVTAEQVARLRDRLHGKQLVLAPGEVVKAEGAKIADSAGIVTRLIMIELPIAWNPDLFLTRAYHRIKHVVFRPAFFVVLLALAVVAFTVWIQSIEAIRLQAAALDVKRSFVLYYVWRPVDDGPEGRAPEEARPDRGPSEGWKGEGQGFKAKPKAKAKPAKSKAHPKKPAAKKQKR